MLTLRRSVERGYANHGWLQSHHSFSFADYHDPAHMGFGNLRVINEDWIEPGRGFGTHGHQDMEIITYVLSGALGHQDSLGNGSTIVPGDVQRMSAGTGILHSEFNHAQQDKTHLLQIWIQPDQRGVQPSYAQKSFSQVQKPGFLCLLASPDGAQASLTMHADARLYAGFFDGDAQVRMPLDMQRKTYVHLVRGALQVNSHNLREGDAAKLECEETLHLSNGQQAEVLLFDLAP